MEPTYAVDFIDDYETSLELAQKKIDERKAINSNKFKKESMHSKCNKSEYVSRLHTDDVESNISYIDQNIQTPNTESLFDSIESDNNITVSLYKSPNFYPTKKLESIKYSDIAALDNIFKELNIYTTENEDLTTNEDFLLKPSKQPSINSIILKQFLLEKYNIKNFMGTFRIYDESKGIYTIIDELDIQRLLYSVVPEKYEGLIKASTLAETVKLLEVTPDIYTSYEDNHEKKFLINCKNGVISLRYYCISEHNPSHGLFNCINANYIQDYDISNTEFNQFLNTIVNGDGSLKLLIQEVVGYTLSNFNNAKKAFLLYGKSNSGKSVFLNLLTSLIGEENCSNVPLQKLSKQEYVVELVGKLMNLCSELPDTPLDDIGIFKSLVSENDKIIGRPLYSNPISFYNICKLVFASNNLPELDSAYTKDNQAYFNRLLIIPFMVSIPEERQDKDLINKLKSELDIIFSWSIDGLYRLINNGFIFTECKSSREILNKYMKESDIVGNYINDCFDIDQNSYIYIDEITPHFKAYLKDLGLNPTKRQYINFLKSTLSSKYNIEYRRIHRRDTNKYGFEGITFKK